MLAGQLSKTRRKRFSYGEWGFGIRVKCTRYCATHWGSESLPMAKNYPKRSQEFLAAWERESICQKGQSCQEVVLKFFWASGARVRKKSLALVRKRVAPVQKRVCTSARDFFLTLAPEAQKNFSTTSWQLCPFWQIDSLSQAARAAQTWPAVFPSVTDSD